MVWPPRYGTAAALSSGGGQTSLRGPGDDEHTIGAIGLLTPNPPSESLFTPSWVATATYTWPASAEPTEQQIRTSVYSFLIRPPEIQGVSGNALYLTEARWPTEGIVNELIGMFIYSRPIGSVNWRANPLFIPFTTADLANISNSALYVERVATVPTDEYQARTRYLWTPPAKEFSSAVLDASTIAGIVLIRVGELLSTSISYVSGIRPLAYTPAYYISDIVKELEERLPVGSYVTPVPSGKAATFVGYYAENLESTRLEASPHGATGAMVVTRYAYATYTA